MVAQPSWEEVARIVQQLVREARPRRVGLRLIVVLDDGERLPLLLPLTEVAPPILAALDGRAMRTDALAHAVGVGRGSLFRKPTGGIDELKREGYVASHPRLGFFRPDAPPEELLDEASSQPQ